MITQAQVQDLFDYRDGALFWKATGRGRKGRAGTLRPDGYRQVGIGTQTYPEHRVIFLLHHGYVPECVDHINRQKDDNRIENLREATPSQNQWNSRPDKKGYILRNGKFRVKIKIKSRQHYFGTYEDVELAGLVASEVRALHHKEFICEEETNAQT